MWRSRGTTASTTPRKRFPFGVADLERFPAHDHIHAVNAVHMGQVDQQEAVAADKALPRQHIVYMDIMMPMLNGMDAARLLREKDEKVILIFVTTMRQYAIPFHGLVLAVFPAGGVVDAVVPLDLHIADITGREAHAFVRFMETKRYE